MLNALPLSSGRPIAREFSSVLRLTNSSRACSRSSSSACGKSTDRFSAPTSSPLQEEAYGVHVAAEPLEPLRPVVRGVLVLRRDLGSADGVAADVPLSAVMPALPVAMPARLLPVVGIRLREEPAQADFLVRREQVIAVASVGRIRRLVGDADRNVALPRQRAVGADAEERHVLGLHVRDVERRSVRRYRETLRRDAAGELQARDG